jgi:two-component system sensor histidine kinase ChiS
MAIFPFAVAVLVTILTAVALFHVDRTERREQTLVVRTELSARLDAVRAKLEAEIIGPLLRTQGVAAQIAAHGDITAEEFARLAPILLEGHRNVVNMALSRGTVIAMVYPLAGNESIIGVDYRDVARQWPTVRQAIETRHPLLQGPVTLIQGYTGLIVRAPVFVPDPGGGEPSFFGIASVVLNVDGVLADAGLTRADLPFRVAIRGRDGWGAAGEIFYGDAAIFSQDPVEMDVALPYGSWRMAAVPAGGWGDGWPMAEPMRLLGLCVLLLVAAVSFGTAYHVVKLKRTGAVLLQTRDSLRRQAAELARSNAELERFSEVSAHHLQEPARRLVTFARRLKSALGEQQLSEDTAQWLSFIDQQASRLRALIRDVQLYLAAGRPMGDALPLAPATVIEAEVAAKAADLSAIGAEVAVDPAMPLVHLDRWRLANMVEILLDNSLRYRRPDLPLRIHVSARAVGRMAQLRFADNGQGIDPEFRDLVFRVFERLHPEDGDDSTGVGLAIVRRIVEHENGRVWIEETPGGGTTVVLELPTESGR